MKNRMFALLLAGVMLLGLLSSCGAETTSDAANEAVETASSVEETAEEASEPSAGAQDMASALDIATETDESAVEEAAATNDPSLELYSYESNYDLGALTTGLPLTENGETFKLWLSVPPQCGYAVRQLRTALR